MPQADHLLIVGASARAAAASAVRAGWRVSAADQFLDADLRNICCGTCRFERPGGLADIVRRCDAAGWLYTGGLENWPSSIDRAADVCRLFGNTGQVLRRVRSMEWLSKLAESVKLPVPSWQSYADDLPLDGSWLCKPRRGSGGWRIAPLVSRGKASRKGGAWHFQQRVSGTPVAAVFVASRGRCVFLGATEQWIGTSKVHEREFAYAGSIGPIDLPNAVRARIEELGSRLSLEAGLVGLFGVDLVVTETSAWTIEVNPRFPASIESLEPSLPEPAVAIHVRACRDGGLPESNPSADGWCAKRIVYSPRVVHVNEVLTESLLQQSESSSVPAFADIPCVGSQIQAGAPLATALAKGGSRHEVEQLIAQREAELLAMCQRWS